MQELLRMEFSTPDPPPLVLTAADLPDGMPLTNRLDKMTTEQAIWAIKNGTAWVTYLIANGGEIVKHKPAPAVEASDEEKRAAILEVLRHVEVEVKDEYGNLLSEMRSEWVETLEWAISALPACYERTHSVLSEELKNVR